MEQIIFIDMEDKPYQTHAGILLDNGDVVCGCCGGLYEKSDRGTTWDIVTVFQEWVNLEETIRG